MVSAVLFYWVDREFNSTGGRFLLIGPFDQDAIRGLLALVITVSSTVWLIARCWVRGVNGTALGTSIRVVGTIAAFVVALIPTLLASLTVAFSLDNKYVHLSTHDGGADIVLQVFNGWDEDETTHVFRREGRFTFTVASEYGYTNCFREINSNTVNVTVDNGAATISADLGSRCRFTPLLVQPK